MFHFADNVLCTTFGNNPFRQRCDRSYGYNYWTESAWDNGNACIKGCELQSEIGCCEARARSGNQQVKHERYATSAYCRFYPNASIANDNKYRFTKATLCSSGI